VQVSGLTGVTAIAAGDIYTVALKSDGTVWDWGYNSNGQLGNNSTTDSHVPVQVSGLSGATAIAAGGSHTVALVGPASPTISTMVSSATITVGQTVFDTATLTGTVNPSGTVTFNVYSNSNGTGLLQTFSNVTISSGSWTSPNFTATSAGTIYWVATFNGDSNNNAVTSSNSAEQVLVNGPAPAVASVVVNGGAPAYTDSNGLSVSLLGQNSVVEQILVTFNEAVDLDPGAFTITNDAAGVTVHAGPTPNTLPVTANFAPVGSDKSQYIVTFSGPGTTAIPGGAGSVIDDGLYILNTLGSHVHANAQTAADTNTGFWALFGSAGSNNVLTAGFIGDGNSEVFVNNPDFTQFRNTFGSESDLLGGPYQPNYDVSMDANLDGFLDAIDYAKFKHNFGADWSF
jgi:hypothetical protein